MRVVGGGTSSMAALPPRKNATPTKIMKTHLSPLQTLLQMGFQKNRAEKALAATGNRSVQLASDWLLAHVHDPLLDDISPREYILYLCPTGPLLEELEGFWEKSLAECGWNGAHNFMPHITLESFFKVHDEDAPEIIQTLKDLIDRHPLLEIGEKMKLESYTSQNFMGFFVTEEAGNKLKRLAKQFVQNVSNTAVFIEPHVKSLHLTLAYQFQSNQFVGLQELVEDLTPTLPSCWELRLYSRDPRIAGHQVHKVLYSHIPREPDELELRIGDYIYLSAENIATSSDGWVEGVSWLTGCTGYLPLNYTERTAESDAWTLHRSIPLYDTKELVDSEIEIIAPKRLNPAIKMSVELLSENEIVPREEKKLYENIDFTGKPATEVKENGIATELGPRQIYISRHGERVDFTFGTWIPYCFDESGGYLRKDLNMPLSVPKRQTGPQGFAKDCPLTRVGELQAFLVGEAMRDAKVQIHHVYCSPSLRCIQTCTGILKGLGNTSLKINIEPALFEWLGWYSESTPIWLTSEELLKAGFRINLDYKPMVCGEELLSKGESCEQYYIRSYFFTEKVIKDTSEKGGNVLLVGHAATLDTCSRQVMGGSPLAVQEMQGMLKKIPYCSTTMMEHGEDNQWRLKDTPFPPITHSNNIRFDWRILQSIQSKQ
ncbi:ecdysteroid-phosphate phosphatase isoform X2 [Cloeon dipterum]|uniref:ecdysteroid-phosphate phosphatase isoform X2 n=1 Tax=Cloeon dipterum TaxID=197152 RepID=UPI00321F6701